MRVFWALFKVMVGLAIAIPVGLFMLAMTGVIVGTAVALMVLAFKLAVVGFIAFGLFKLGSSLLSPSAPAARPARPVREIPAADPYYESAMRELNRELAE